MSYREEANDAYNNELARLSWICSASDEQLRKMSKPMEEMFGPCSANDPENVREYARKRQNELDFIGRDKFIADYVEKCEQEDW